MASGTLQSLLGAGLKTGTGVKRVANLLIEGNSTLSGDIAAAQTLVVQANQPGGDTATLTAANGFTNAGTITLQGIGPFDRRSEERRVGKEGRSPWSPDH